MVATAAGPGTARRGAPSAAVPPRPPAGSLRRRIAVALVGIPAALALAWLGGWWLAAALALLAAGGADEVYRLAARGGVRPFRGPGALAAAAFALLAAADGNLAAAGARLAALAFALVMTSATLAAWLRPPRDARPLEAAAVTVAGALYTGGPLAAAVLLRALPGSRADGFALLMFPVVVVWVCDTAAFVVGRSLGKIRLAPVVSPGKTLEGAVAGLVAAGPVAAVYPLLVPASSALAALPAWAPPAAGVALALAGVAGDLAKSAWKREAGVKDSGAVFPGHGGIVDRLDSLFYALPIALLLALATR